MSKSKGEIFISYMNTGKGFIYFYQRQKSRISLSGMKDNRAAALDDSFKTKINLAKSF